MPPGVAKLRQVEAQARGSQQVATAARAAGAAEAENQTLLERHKRLILGLKEWLDSPAPNVNPALAKVRKVFADLAAEFDQ